MDDNALKQLYNSKKYEDVIARFMEEYNKETLSEWDYVYTMHSYTRLKRFEEGIELFKIFHKVYPEKTLLNDEYGRCLYYVHIKNFDFDNDNPQRYCQGVKYVLDNCSKDSKYSPVNYVTKHALEAVFNRRLAVNINYQYANDLLSILNPMELSDEEFEVETDSGKRIGPTEREKWYLRKAKSLYKIGEYEECLKVAEEGLKNITKMHNCTDKWLYYRCANCFYEMGDIVGAKETLENGMKSFDPWQKYQLQMKIAIAENDYANAARYAALCALSDRKHEVRVGFYYEYAEYLIEEGKDREAALLFRFVDVLRTENSWGSKKMPEGFSIPNDIAAMDKASLLKELLAIWRQNREYGIEFSYGKVKKLMSEGKSGFITSDEGHDYYFNKRDFENRNALIEEGTRVRFSLEERLDKAKNEKKMNAVNISIVR